MHSKVALTIVLINHLNYYLKAIDYPMADAEAFYNIQVLFILIIPSLSIIF